MAWLKKLWPVAAVFAVLALVFGGRERRNEQVEQSHDEFIKHIKDEKRRRTAQAISDATDRRATKRRMSADDRAKGILRRARERLRRDAK